MLAIPRGSALENTFRLFNSHGSEPHDMGDWTQELIGSAGLLAAT